MFSAVEYFLEQIARDGAILPNAIENIAIEHKYFSKEKQKKEGSRAF